MSKLNQLNEFMRKYNITGDDVTSQSTEVVEQTSKTVEECDDVTSQSAEVEQTSKKVEECDDVTSQIKQLNIPKSVVKLSPKLLNSHLTSSLTF